MKGLTGINIDKLLGKCFILIVIREDDKVCMHAIFNFSMMQCMYNFIFIINKFIVFLF